MKKLSILIVIIFTCFIATGQSLLDGEYLIKINQTGKYFAIAGASKDNGAWAIQWDNEYTSHFKFIIKHLGNNVYSLKAKHSGKYLSTEGVPKAGAKLVQWDWLNQDNQKWYILPQNGTKGFVLSSFQNNMKVVLQYWNSTVTAGNGAYFFLQGDMNMRSMVLDFKKNETAQIEGSQYKDIPTSKTVFPKGDNNVVRLVRDVPDGVYKIYINQSRKYLAIAGQEDMSNGMRLVQWDMLPKNNHLFNIKKLPNGSYNISPVHSQKVLDVVDMRTEDGTQVQQWDNLGYSNQEWKFYNENDGVSIVSVASKKKLQLSAGVNNTSNGTPLIITESTVQTFQLLPARAIQFTDHITFKNVRFAVPQGGDLDMFGEIKIFLVDKHGNSYNRYYESQYNKATFSDNTLFSRAESQPVNMDKNRIVDLGGEVKFKIDAAEIPGARIIIVYGINENDADVASLFTSYGTAEIPEKRPDAMRQVNLTSYRAGGSDDFYKLKTIFNDRMKSWINKDGWSYQEVFVKDIPAHCLVHANLQDEDGSDNWLNVYFTVTKERR